MAGVVVDPTQPGPPQRSPSRMMALMAAESSVTGNPSAKLLERAIISLPPSPLAPHCFTFRKTR